MMGEVENSEDGRCVDVVAEVEDVGRDEEEEVDDECFTEDDDNYFEEYEEEDDELEFEEDDTKMFTDRVNYFAGDPSAASFIGFGEEENKKAREMISNKAGGRYININDDHDMFQQIESAVEPFLTSVALKQIWYSYSTNRKENMNHVVATYAPKYCHFSTSLSLATRVSIASGTQVVGHFPYWSMLLSRAEIRLHPTVENYLKKRDEKRERQCEIQVTAERKLSRTAKLRDTIQKEIEADKKAKKDSKTYTSSSGVDRKAAEKAVEEAMKAKRTKD